MISEGSCIKIQLGSQKNSYFNCYNISLYYWWLDLCEQKTLRNIYIYIHTTILFSNASVFKHPESCSSSSHWFGERLHFEVLLFALPLECVSLLSSTEHLCSTFTVHPHSSCLSISTDAIFSPGPALFLDTHLLHRAEELYYIFLHHTPLQS